MLVHLCISGRGSSSGLGNVACMVLDCSAWGGCVVFPWWHKCSSHQSERAAACVRQRLEPTTERAKSFEVQQDALIALQDFAEAVGRSNLQFKSPKQATRVDLQFKLQQIISLSIKKQTNKKASVLISFAGSAFSSVFRRALVLVGFKCESWVRYCFYCNVKK